MNHGAGSPAVRMAYVDICNSSEGKKPKASASSQFASAAPLTLPEQYHFVASMTERHDTAVQLVAFAAFVAAIIVFVLVSLTFIAAQCSQGTPFLPAVFPCFPGG